MPADLKNSERNSVSGGLLCASKVGFFHLPGDGIINHIFKRKFNYESAKAGKFYFVVLLFLAAVFSFGCIPQSGGSSRNSGGDSVGGEATWSTAGLDEKSIDYIKQFKANKSDMEFLKEHKILPGENEDQCILRVSCEMNVKQIMYAIDAYHAANSRYQSAYTVDAKGNKLHSWRVTILPYMNQQELYEKIRLNEPWDSEHNKQFHSQMPSFYACPACLKKDNASGLTSRKWVVGPDMFSQGESTSNQILVSNFSLAVVVESLPTTNWMEPVDIMQEDIGKVFGNEGAAGSRHFKGVNVGMLDGSVKFVSDPQELDNLCRPRRTTP